MFVLISQKLFYGLTWFFLRIIANIKAKKGHYKPDMLRQFFLDQDPDFLDIDEIIVFSGTAGPKCLVLLPNEYSHHIEQYFITFPCT